MSKGYVKLAMAIIFMLVLYVIVNYILAQLLNSEIVVSDKISQIYRMINAVEVARAHSTHVLGLSTQAAKDDLDIEDFDEIKNDIDLKNNFIEKIKEYFHPSVSYSNVDIGIKVDSVDVEDSRVISILNLEIVHLSPDLRGSVIYGDIKVWSEI